MTIPVDENYRVPVDVNYRSPFNTSPEPTSLDKENNYLDGILVVLKYSQHSGRIREASEKYERALKEKPWLTPHEQWVNSREDYASSGNEAYLDKMLSYVTLDNPPLAKSFTESFNDPSLVSSDDKYRSWTRLDIGAVISFLLIGITACGFFGGFKSVAMMVVTLFVIFGISVTR